MKKTLLDSQKPPLRNLRRILIVHPFGIGDVLFVTPVIRALKEKGSERIDLLLGSRTRRLFEHCPHVTKIYEWSKDKPKNWNERFAGCFRIVRLFWELFCNRYDAFLDFSLNREYAFYAKYVWGIPVRVGFDYKKRGIFLNYRRPLENGFSDKPVTDDCLELLKFFGIENPSCHLELFLSERDRQSAKEILRQERIQGGEKSYLVVSPGGGESWGKDARFKRWPVNYFAELIRKISIESGFEFSGILILGSRTEFEIGTELEKLLPKLCVRNLCGKTDIRTSAALIETALFVLANDGGIVHIAGALKTPVIAVYGPVDERVYGPSPDCFSVSVACRGLPCRPCYQRMRYRVDCPHLECLTRLTPEAAYEEIRNSGFFSRFSDARKNSL